MDSIKSIVPEERVTVQAIEEILGKELLVLDKGFIRVIDYMGTDSSIVQGARVSYGKGTKTVNQDQGLINYLMRNDHTSPFEMCEIKLHVKLPIFVARQWIRHRTANVNEYSARYSILTDDFYVPELDQLVEQSKGNKQGRDSDIPIKQKEFIREEIQRVQLECYELYQFLISPEINLTRELSRTVLPVSIYTEWYWKIDLHNLLHFIKLRLDQHAQFEIREYAKVMLEILEKWCPMTATAFKTFKLEKQDVTE